MIQGRIQKVVEGGSEIDQHPFMSLKTFILPQKLNKYIFKIKKIKYNPIWSIWIFIYILGIYYNKYKFVLIHMDVDSWYIW